MRKRELDAIEDIATELSKIANTFNLPDRAFEVVLVFRSAD